MPVVEVIRARGHRNVRATHRSTFEITRDESVTPRGDCIIAVAADKACADLNPHLKSALRARNARVEILIQCAGTTVTVRALGSPNLVLSDPRSIVVRKSQYIDARTLAIRANKAAADFPRPLVSLLRRGEPVLVTVSVTR